MRSQLRIFQTLILRPLRRDLLRTALTILSVALGVAVVIAIELAGEAAAGSFYSSLETLLGRTDLVITGNAGVDESLMAPLTALPVNATFSPVIETQAVIERLGAFTLYGVDAVASGMRLKAEVDPDSALMISEALANRLHVREGSRLSLQLNDHTRAFQVAGIVSAKEAEFLLLDIAVAQKALNQYGRLDRIEVQAPRQDIAKLEAQIRAILPPSCTIERPGVRREENQRMLRAFRWNLRVLSYISLVVGAFLIYNTISISVVRRRAEIGILRALGAGRQRVFWLFLAEALLFGLAGSIAGLLFGRMLAEAAVGLISQTVNSLYTSSRPAPIALNAAAIFTGIAAGLTVALLSALGPARDAMQVTPAEAMARGAHEHQSRMHWRRNLGWAAALAILAAIATRFQPIDGKPLMGYVATLLSVLAAALTAPALVVALTAMARPAIRRLFGAEGILAGRSLAASLSRTSVIVGALATAISMMASVGIMVSSFRETVLVWLDSQLRADLYVRPAGRTGAGQFPALSADVPPLVASVPGVEAVDIFHAFELRFRGLRATLGAGDLEIVRRHGRLRFLPGEDRDVILRSLPGQDRAIVSEPFANKHGVHPGDKLTLPLRNRNVTVTIAGIYYEYSSEQGYVILDRSTLLKYLPDQPATNLAVYLSPGFDAEQVRHAIQERTANYRITVAPNQALRQNAILIFDRTFAITYALEGVAILVAMLGAANSLLALVLDRRRELGLLRYLGAAGTQIRRMILLEAGLLGLLANLLGLALGFVLSVILIYVINKQSFGWTIQFHPPFRLLAAASALVWFTTMLAGLYPARVAARLNPIEVIHEE